MRYWSLSVRSKNGAENNRNNNNNNEYRVFGAGFFDDSGDIPNQPILFFSLSGTWDKQSNCLSLTKVYLLFSIYTLLFLLTVIIYEKHDITEGFEVNYKGK